MTETEKTTLEKKGGVLISEGKHFDFIINQTGLGIHARTVSAKGSLAVTWSKIDELVKELTEFKKVYGE